LSDIQNVTGTLRPLPGSKKFLDELRSFVQVIRHSLARRTS